MPNNTRFSLTFLTAVGAGVALVATVLPWYSFDVVLPVPGIIHVFAVTVTLWGVTTVAPILIVVGGAVALFCAAALDWRLAGVITGVIGLAIAVYAVVRCFDVPALGVGGLPAVPAITQVEGGPFVALAGGLMILGGALADLVSSPAGARRPRLSASRTRTGTSVPPPHAAR